MASSCLSINCSTTACFYLRKNIFLPRFILNQEDTGGQPGTSADLSCILRVVEVEARGHGVLHGLTDWSSLEAVSGLVTQC